MTLISKQEETGKCVSQLQTKVQDEIDVIKSSIDRQDNVKLQTRQNEENLRQEAFDLLKTINKESTECSRSCSEMNERLAEWIEKQQEGTALMGKFDQQLQEREGVIAELETKIQLLTEDYAAKVDAMRTTMLQSNEVSEKHIQDTVAAVSEMLEKKFEGEKQKFERKFVQSGVSRAELESGLKEVKNMLAEISSTANPKVVEMAQSLGKEQEAVTILTERLKQFEQEATKTNQLRER